MSLVCAQCSRVNPADAAYCYNDGAALAGRAGGPINVGSAPFPHPFVFPDGLACRNFDQLASACQQHWSAARDLLKQGFFGTFLGSMGRVDLAKAAQDAAALPDLDRGLDQLLVKLPTQAVQPPKLQAEPSEVNLGRIKPGADHATQLHLTNVGMRLLYGTATSDCDWLTLGDAPGHAEKVFQFGGDAIIPVQVRGAHLRAGAKPLEGRVVVHSNGGALTVTVRAEVPITPFAGGLFDGAVTPRQIAEKAKANTKEAVPYFENGAVAKWYTRNGWKYPVQGPTMPGMGGIQQFFEALGVAKAPKVDVTPKALALQGEVGQIVKACIEVTEVTNGKRKVVYGWAACAQPWVEIGKSKLTSKNAIIPLTIRIPDSCPPTLETTITVMGNGNQKTVVPLRVVVAAGKRAGRSAPPTLDSRATMEAPLPVELVAQTAPVHAPVHAPSPFTIGDASTAVIARSNLAPGAPLARRFVPLVVLCVFVGLIIARDFYHSFGIPDVFAEGGLTNLTKGKTPPKGKSEEELETFIVKAADVDARPHVKVVFDEGTFAVDYSDSMSFGVHKIDQDGLNAVKLNWYENGLGNSNVVKIDGKENIFGQELYGYWKPVGPAKATGRFGGKTRTFVFKLSQVYVTQTVTVEPGDFLATGPDVSKRPLNVCLARYKIRNDDRKTHSVGLRILLDTCIGLNDGVPFTIPGVSELVSTAMDFEGPKVPDFVQVLERPDLKDPGIIVHLNMRISDRLERPNRFLLTRYPQANKRDLHRWEIPKVDFRDDSCVVMYWDERDLKPNEVREVAFTYGLGSLTLTPVDKKRDRGGQLALTVGGAMYLRGELTIVALVADPSAKTATLKLPAGLELLEGPLTKPVVSRPGPDGKYRPVPVTWRARALSDGLKNITVTTDSKLTETRRVTITAKSLFN